MAILNQDKMTSHRLGGRLILLLLLFAALWIPQSSQASTIILEDMVVSKCFKKGSVRWVMLQELRVRKPSVSGFICRN